MLWRQLPLRVLPSTRCYATLPTKRSGASIIDQHLDSIVQSTDVVLADVEALRPPGEPPVDSPTYATQYKAALASLTGSFNAKQLQQFLKLYRVPVPADRKKAPLAKAILEQTWRWPSLESVRERERAAELSTELLPLTPTQAFLVLGKDGTESRELSHKHGVRMTFKTNPLSLQIDGTRSALTAVSKEIAHLKSSIVEDFFDLLPESTVKPEILNRISRLTGALLEPFGDGRIRISYLGHDARLGIVAKRLLAQSLCENSSVEDRRLFFYLPPTGPRSSDIPASSAFPRDYGLYPFMSPRFLPWSTSSRGVFRMRRVEDMLDGSSTEDLLKTGGLAMGRGHLLGLDQQAVDMRILFDASNPTASNPIASKSIIASIGHFLLTSPPGKQFSITPPLQGHQKMPQVLSWLSKFSDPVVFAPTLPHRLSSAISDHKALHRLVYRSLNAAEEDAYKIFKVEVALPGSAVPDGHAWWSSSIQCAAGRVVDFDVLMPDRPFDIRFSVLETAPVVEDGRPTLINDYLHKLNAFLGFEDPDAVQPDPPITLDFDGTTYLLQACLNVRQKAEPGDDSALQTITESAVDSEGEQKSASCEVIHTGSPMNDSAWRSFLSACDAMSTFVPP
ncbi:hypothetical protein MKEN_00829400 [Mycena kentingensis (nom. inval.)]|nr:hypothetical protein MKEN_00829400 [Mycena kentingensis (nom. inval.)]